MKIKRMLFYIVGLVLMTPLFFTFNGWAQTKPEVKAPIITHAYAVDKGNYGYIWKIYIEAEDPDGNMSKIASVVDQVGFGHYPPSWIYLKPQYQKHFKGYLQWNTFSSNASELREWTQITLRVSVFDKAGNESSEVVFPFTFETGVRGQYQYILPPPFDQENLPRLGHIHINLFEPTMMGGARDN